MPAQCRERSINLLGDNCAREFVRREIWHGTGDCQSLRGFFSSKIAIVGVGMLHAMVLGLLIAVLTGHAVWAVVPICASLAVSAIAAFIRYAKSPLRVRLVNVIIYFIYFCSRGLSPYAAIKKARKQKAAESRH